MAKVDKLPIFWHSIGGHSHLEGKHMPDTSGQNVVTLKPKEQQPIKEQLEEDFKKLFCRQVEAQREGHHGDIVPRTTPYEP